MTLDKLGVCGLKISSENLSEMDTEVSFAKSVNLKIQAGGSGSGKCSRSLASSQHVW